AAAMDGVADLPNDSPLHDGCYEDDDCNYAAYDAREELALLGVPFHGWHSAGGDYEAATFASTGDGQLYEWSTTNDGDAIIRLTAYGEDKGDMLQFARETIWMSRRAEQIVAGQLEPDQPSPGTYTIVYHARFGDPDQTIEHRSVGAAWKWKMTHQGEYPYIR